MFHASLWLESGVSCACTEAGVEHAVRVCRKVNYGTRLRLALLFGVVVGVRGREVTLSNLAFARARRVKCQLSAGSVGSPRCSVGVGAEELPVVEISLVKRWMRYSYCVGHALVSPPGVRLRGVARMCLRVCVCVCVCVCARAFACVLV